VPDKLLARADDVIEQQCRLLQLLAAACGAKRWLGHVRFCAACGVKGRSIGTRSYRDTRARLRLRPRDGWSAARGHRSRSRALRTARQWSTPAAGA